ncbi:MAG: type II toxin-antitoxin system RelE family toxin [Ilumatobacteraceae bacterium]
MTGTQYELRVTGAAQRQLGRLPERVAAAVVAFVVGPLADRPRAVGHPLRRELAGQWSARCGAYRVLYEIDDDSSTVIVLRIDHRADIYRPR